MIVLFVFYLSQMKLKEGKKEEKKKREEVLSKITELKCNNFTLFLPIKSSHSVPFLFLLSICEQLVFHKEKNW